MEITLSRSSIALRLSEKELIEEYKLDESITLSKFIGFLLSHNLEEKVDFINTVNDPNEPEKELINLITSLIEDYNKKVIELTDFISLQKKAII